MSDDVIRVGDWVERISKCDIIDKGEIHKVVMVKDNLIYLEKYHCSPLFPDYFKKVENPNGPKSIYGKSLVSMQKEINNLYTNLLKKENKMNKVIEEVFPVTKEANVVQKHIDDKMIRDIIISKFPGDVLRECLKLEEDNKEDK